MTWFDHEDVRMSYFGHGQSANQQKLFLVNESTNGDIILDCAGTGIIDCGVPIKAVYRSSDGTAGITYTANNGQYTQLIFKNGLLVGAS